MRNSFPAVASLLLRAKTWLDAEEPASAIKVPRAAAFAAIALLYLIGWGPGTYRAVAYLLGRYPDGPWWAAIASGAQGLAVVLLALVVIRRVGGSWRALGVGSGRVRWRREALGGSWAFLLAVAAFLVGDLLLPMRHFPAPESNAGRWDLVVGAVAAGPAEELALLVAPLLLLRASGTSWRWVFVWLVLLRVSFHVYYGWGSVALALWAAGLVVVYLRTRAVVGLVVAHAAFDLGALPAQFDAEAPFGGIRVGLFFLALGIVGADLVRRVPRTRDPSRLDRYVLTPLIGTALFTLNTWYLAKVWAGAPAATTPGTRIGQTLLDHQGRFLIAAATLWLLLFGYLAARPRRARENRAAPGRDRQSSWAPSTSCSTSRGSEPESGGIKA